MNWAVFTGSFLMMVVLVGVGWIAALIEEYLGTIPMLLFGMLFASFVTAMMAGNQ